MRAGLLNRHWWRFWQPPGANLPPIMVCSPDRTQDAVIAHEVGNVEEQIQSWDCAFKDLQTSDYVVGQVWGSTGSCFLLVDHVRDRMDARRRSKPFAAFSSAGRAPP